MKPICDGKVFGLGLVVISFLLDVAPLAYSQTREPFIQSIRPQGTNVLVSVDVPVGVRRVTLESRARIGGGAWVPASVVRSEGKGGTVTFVVPVSKQTELLRVRSDWNEPLPGSFYTGRSLFTGASTNNDARYYGWVTDAAGNPPAESVRTVVESDIWKVASETLYFFNQNRGLQVIDISNPDAASIDKVYPLPASGEQMYVIGDGQVVLLTRQWCNSGGDQSQALIINTTETTPKLIATLPVPGSILESRMVGDVLYVASQSYLATPDRADVWEWGTEVSSFDLADPAKPVTRNKLWFPGYGNVVAATDTFLFVVTQDPGDWWRSVVRIIDITSVDGSMSSYGQVVPAGRIQDKFKVHQAGSVLTTISEDSRRVTPESQLVTRLETFHLPDPRSGGPGSIAKLGEVELGHGERLHATRFDEDRVYVVTFFQIDPLWVVDLSDPARPRIAGSVDVPGWSTFIHPLGERLVTIGIETNRAAVSLFDVRDPAHPSLLSRVPLGDEFSWTEANYDEKAFSVLEEAGLVLVPFSGDMAKAWVSSVQIIDLLPASLKARGVVQHELQPRRATYTRDRVLSVSGWELLSVDISDRDRPVVKGELTLAFPVDRVLVHGDYLVQISSGSDSWTGGEAAVRLSAKAEPDRVLSELRLGNMPIVGATVRNSKLHLAQSSVPSYRWYWGAEDGTDGDSTVPFVHTIIDLASAPVVSISGQATAAYAPQGWGSSWEAVWPKEGLLVWSGGGSSSWWGPWFLDIGMPLSFGGMMPWPGGYSGGGELAAVDVSDPAAPAFTSWIRLADKQEVWDFSRPFAAGPLVYVSHRTVGPPPDPGETGDWVQNYFLDVIDYTDSAEPTVRTPVNIPGTLRGLARDGELLFTTGPRPSKQVSMDEWLDALAYDGVAAHLIDSLRLSTNWPRPVLTVDSHVLIGFPVYETSGTPAAHELQSWSLDSTGKFTLNQSTELAAPASTLSIHSQLLAVFDSLASLRLFDATSPDNLRPSTHGQPSTCYWYGYDLEKADGSLTDGLWLPLGSYGVLNIGISP